MKRQLFLESLTALVLVCLFFQTGVCNANGTLLNPPELQALIKKMQKRFDRVRAFKADFKQETYSGAAQLTTSGKGKLYIKKPRMMRWDYSEPERQSFVTDGKTTWLYIPAEKRILIDDARHFFDSPLVKSFLDGPKNLKKYFKVRAKRDSNYKGFVLILTPGKQNKQLEIEKIKIWVKKGRYQIEAVETKDYMGNRNKVTLENIEVKETLPDGLFKLTVPGGVVVERNVDSGIAPQK